MRTKATTVNLGRSANGDSDAARNRSLRFNNSRRRNVRPPATKILPEFSADEEDVAARIEEIKQVWSQGAGNSLALARVVWDTRRYLPHGQWERALKLLPFSKRKANMLATVGKGLNWVTGQMIAQIPAGWSILYQLVQLKRATFERLLEEGVIHPGLSLQEARELLAKFKGRRRQPNAQRSAVIRRWLQQFRIYVRRTVKDWRPEEREMAKSKLAGLLELIEAGDGNGVERNSGKILPGLFPRRRISVTRRAAAPLSLNRPKTTL